MTRTIKILFLIIMVFNFIGCTDDFDEMNQNPTGIAEIKDAKLFLLPMLMQGYTDSYQITTNLYHDLYSQHWANMHGTFDSGYYAHHDGWIKSRWKRFYSQWVVPNYSNIKKIYENDPASNNIYQIARIWMLFNASQMVDTWGDIPFSEMYKGGISIKYDDDEEIYKSIISGLKEASTSFKTSGQVALGSDYEPIFNGNIDSWKRFANTIIARLSMRMVNADKNYAQQNFVAAVNDGIILTNDQNALQPCDGVTYYNYFLFFAQWIENAMSKTIENHLRNTSSVVDPRMMLWFEECGNGGYNGIQNGDNANASKNTAVYSTGNKAYWTYDKPYVIALASDSKFMMAEAALRGWVTGDVDALTKEGVALNMDFWGVATADRDAYIAGLPAVAGTNEEKLEKIMTQRWLGNFTNGPEGWANVRRTDYPTLMPVLHSVSTTVPKGSFIKRILYIENEHKLNKAIPVSANEDSQNKRIFWDTSDDTPQNFN